MSVVTIIMSIMALSGTITLLCAIWALYMWCLGINVISVIRGDKLLIIEVIHYIPKTQGIVDVCARAADKGIVEYISRRASEWGIDTTHTSDTTWVRHSTDTYECYSKR